MTIKYFLSGPILRRVEPTCVCIWAATDLRVDLTAHVYKASDLNTSLGHALARRVKLGDRLYIHLAEVKPASGVYPEDMLAYDIQGIQYSDGKQFLTVSLRDIAEKEELVYPPYKLPTFFLQGTKALNIIHASCRKPHAPNADALPAADRLVRVSAGDARERPQALFLTGDQIYADDVANDLIELLTVSGKFLTGHYETIPGLPKQINEYAPAGRMKDIKNVARFTSNESGNHLISFGEFAAMYLFAWNEQNWSFADLNKTGLKMDQKVLYYFQGLKSVRRVLANTATYMMFDDHEVTDDWNIAQNRKQTVQKSPAGRRIVANALAAYWAFQAWGNQPENFPDAFINVIEAHLSNTNNDEAKAKAFEDALWSFTDWAFFAPTKPVAWFMDTRTQRDVRHTGGSDEPPARLMNASAWSTALSSLRSKAKFLPNQPLLLIAPAPVLGPETIDFLQQAAAKIFDPYKFDLESWIANPVNIVDLVEFLLELSPSMVVILSGDVHFAYAAAATIDRFNPKFVPSFSRKNLHFVQITSSAAKNTPGQKSVPNRLTSFSTWHKTRSQPQINQNPAEGAFPRPPDFTLSVRFLGKNTVDILWDNNIGHLKTDGVSVEHHFLNAGDEHRFNFRWYLNRWPTRGVD